MMPRRIVRFAATLPLLALVASIGCFGGAHNPGYFPNLIPPGDIIQTHAKPPGGAYFRDFDPKAVRLELTPAQSTCKPGGEQVFVATVYDRDGQPRRSRRVEWMIEGPGNIVEVDESGWTAGRGYKVNNKYAISYTDYREHTLTRGNTNSRDDFTINPGQTWCVVMCAVPGETVVTAYAPGVHEWEKGRATAKVNWGDNSEFTFPAATSGRIGGEAALNTFVKKVAEREGVTPADLRVRYRINGGVPAELIPPPEVSGARAGIDSLDLTVLSDGRAPVRVKQMNPKAGRTDIGIEVFKPDADGVGVGKVVGRSTTSVDWSAPGLSLDILAPKTLAPNKEGQMTLVATNTGIVEGSPVQIAMRFIGYDVLPEESPTDRRGEDEMSWTIPALAAGQKKEIRMRVRPKVGDGRLTAEARALSQDDLRASASASTDVGAAGLKVGVDPKINASVGERIPVKVVVTNPSQVALDTATAVVTFGAGLEHDAGENQAEATVGVVPAGESRTVTIPLIARRTGQYKVRASVKAGDLTDAAETVIEVRRPEIKLVVQGPERINPGSDSTFEIGVSNPGEVTVPSVSVKAALPAGLTAKQASESGTVSTSSVLWRVGDLPPGGRKVLTFTATADRVVEKGIVTATATSGEQTATGGTPLNVKADAPVTIQGKPALLLELADPTEPVPIGRRAGYRVIIRNKGNGPAKFVKATAYLPEEYANVKASGPNREAVKPEGSKLIFPVIREIPANGVVTLYIEVEGAKIGDARMRVEVQADYLAKPLSEEQTTRVLERR
jgi:hypothetical protein